LAGFATALLEERRQGGVELGRLDVEVVGLLGPLGEAERVVEVGRGGNELGVCPDGITCLGALRVAQRTPQRRSVA